MTDPRDERLILEELHRARAEIVRLRDALRPFAEACPPNTEGIVGGGTLPRRPR